MKILPEQPSWSPYPMGVAASIPRDASFFAEENETKPITVPCLARYGGVVCIPQSDHVLEMGIAKTELVREISDGIPITIGEDESTKPTHAPKASTAVFTDGLARSSGVDW